jgi:hypothetical protein
VANTGVIGTASAAAGQQIQASDTGDATVTGAGDANTGIRLD